ncbi:glycosyltransferase family 2 protein [uncultured Massilia sp.]|uniref:glycosyltransferase family 2 protein n=1 Tax=uncultured Massilia sp. TaxID=169973 RepID=UPI0025F0166C|nr:glycosyltransferase [uncultured Massilia sp.]
MDLSVVICTRNRAARLPETLAKLRDLQPPDVSWELVFVDNNSSDNTLDILKEFSLHASIPIQVVREKKAGLSNARNAGWRAARGAIVAFTDDDCYPQEDWLVAVVRAFREPDLGYVGGRVLLFDPDDAPITIQTSTQPVFYPAHSHIESGQIIGANFSCTRRLLEAVDGFDPHLGAGTTFDSGEDTDVLIRASLLGFTGRYDPAVVVFHHHRRRLENDVKKLYCGYAFGRGALSMKTILESRARKLYLKNWYWRLRSLLRQGHRDYCLHELAGATRFVRSRLSGARRSSDRAAPEIWHFEGDVHGAARLKQAGTDAVGNLQG